MPTPARLLISLGAQKAGTNWLHNYFRTHPEAAVPPIKELHYFLTATQVMQRKVAKLEARDLSACTDASGRDPAAQHAFVERARILSQQPGRSVADFQDLMGLLAGAKTKVIGEFTPANGVMKLSSLEALAKLNPRPRFLLVLRDPVDRMWSQIRMQARKAADHPDQIADVALTMLESFLASEQDKLVARHRYDVILAHARAAIPAEQLQVRFFETFFAQRELDSLCRFLGLNTHPGQIMDKKYEGVAVALDQAARRRLRDRLINQYRAVEQSISSIPSRWRESLDL